MGVYCVTLAGAANHMLDNERAIETEFVAAIVTILITQMDTIADQGRPFAIQNDAMKQPRGAFGEQHPKAVVTFLEYIAALALGDLPAG